MSNSIAAGNTAVDHGPDGYGTVASLGHNLVQTPAELAGLVTSDLTGINPLLGSLDTTTGPVPFLPLPSTSPAIEAADPSLARPPTPGACPGSATPTSEPTNINSRSPPRPIPATARSARRS